MKKYFLKLFCVAFLILISAGSFFNVFAARLTPTGPTGDVVPTTVTSFLDVQLIAYRILKWVYTAFFLVAVLFILLAAYNFVLGGQNEKRIATAKNQLKWAVIAIVVALVSGGVDLIISGFLITGH